MRPRRTRIQFAHTRKPPGWRWFTGGAAAHGYNQNSTARSRAPTHSPASFSLARQVEETTAAVAYAEICVCVCRMNIWGRKKKQFPTWVSASGYASSAATRRNRVRVLQGRGTRRHGRLVMSCRRPTRRRWPVGILSSVCSVSSFRLL